MILLLDYDISQDFWRLVYPASRVPGVADAIPKGEKMASTMVDVKSFAPNWITKDFLAWGSKKLDVLVFDKKDRRVSKDHLTRLWSGGIPEGSFYHLGNGVFVCSPEFLFLRLASSLGFYELIAYGDELCGLYAFDPNAMRHLRKRSQPLTTIKKLHAFLLQAKGCLGCGKALRALPFIVERSASPMETVSEMLLCLPYRHGGYGLPTPEMNFEIPLSGRAVQLAGQGVCYADLCWDYVRFVYEYHGLYDHANPQDFQDDRGRVDAIKLMGYNVMEVTYKQVSNLLAFESIAVEIARIAGKKIKPNSLGALRSRQNLRSELFQWNHREGHRS